MSPEKALDSIVVTFHTVRQIALSLDHVEESTSYGTPAFKVRGQLFVRLHQDGESLIVRMDPEQRAAMIAEDPETYYLTDHYLNYPWILVRMSRIQPAALRDLLIAACKLASATKSRSSKTPQSPSRNR